MESFNFESALGLVGLVVYLATFVTVPVLFARNIKKDRPKALRAAATQTADLVAQLTVWLVLVSGLSYAALVGVDEHGVAVVVGTVVAPVMAACLAVLGGWLYSRTRQEEVD